MTDLQRQEHVAEWIRLVEREAAKKLGQVAPVSKGGRGKTGGVRAARELPLSGRSEEGRRKSAERAVKVAAIDPEAKAAVQAAGLVYNQTEIRGRNEMLSLTDM